ncbi:MAG: HAD-IIA family hydrolase [Nitrososphaerales archaeon]|nr:HAD-IIA family hydrolase [Nitrososphaerales archaeon]
MIRRGDLGKKKLFLFDLDGVFYKGKETRVKIGGTKIVEELRRRGKKLLVLTNDSTDTVETIHSRLRASGIPVRREEILSSAFLTAQYLKNEHGKVTYFLLGEPGLDAELRRFGHRRTVGDRADFVVIGLDRKLTYEKLNHAARVVRNGASIVATHVAPLYMGRDGPAVATGPVVKALEYATGKRATAVGKPSPLMFRIALRDAGCSRHEAVMIGDQIDTDILGAVRAGVDAILVKTGVDRDIRGTGALGAISSVDALAALL